MRIPNPIDKRLDFVRKQYGQETYEKTRKIVAANLGIAESEIAPGQRVDWERFIPWLGKQVHRILKRGPQAAPELKRLETGFLHSIEPFMVKKKALVLKEGKVVKRRPELERLTPKRARQAAGRQQERLHESRVEQARRLGYKKVAGLGNGYTAVQAVIDPNARPPQVLRDSEQFFPPGLEYKEREIDAIAWIEKYAPFQQWLGVELANCLQFYKVNYEPHGSSSFDLQRQGGKLYGILDPKGKPVAAILANPDGSILETNGPGNRPPPEKDYEYVERFITKHLKQQAPESFIPPRNFPQYLEGMIEYTIDAWPDNDRRGKRKFIRKVTGYSRQQGASFPAATMQILVWMLWTSDDSLNKIVSQFRPTQKELSRLRKKLRTHIKTSFDSYKRALANIHMGKERYAIKGKFQSQEGALMHVGQGLAKLRDKISEKLDGEMEDCYDEACLNRIAEMVMQYVDVSMSNATLNTAFHTAQDPKAFAVGHEVGSIDIRFSGISTTRSYLDLQSEWAVYPLIQQQVADLRKHRDEDDREVSEKYGFPRGSQEIHEIAISLEEINPGPLANDDQNAEWRRVLKVTHRKVASKILEEMRDAARTAGAAPGPAGNPTGARALVRDCRVTWEAYCEKPGKTRLKKVFSCLKKMEKSKAATVKSERTRCLRSARAEKRKHKWDF